MATSKPTYDCFNDMPEVEPNGDISGPGVLAGFLGTAYLSILVLAVYYFRVFEPTKNPYQEQPQPSSSSISIQSTNTNEASQQHESQTLPSNRDDLSQQQEGSPSEDQLDPSAQTEADWAPNPIDIWFLENVPKIFELLHKLGQRLAAYLFPDILGRGFRNMQLICKLVYELVSMLVSRMISMLVSMSIYKLAQKWFPMALLRALKKALDTQLDPQQDTKEEIERAFNECMRSICDTQLVTGVGILFSAYYILNKTDSDGKGLITAYHWQIAVYLAWLSNLTHMTGLTFLRKYLAHHKTERLWRTVSMICLFLLVFIAFPPLLYFNWDADDIESEAQPSTASSNAFCYYQYHVYWALVAGIWVSVRILKARSSAQVDEGMASFGQVLAVFLLISPLVTTLVALWPLRFALWELRQPRDPPGCDTSTHFRYLDG
ncbi:hypothetical protein F5X68DRAFT_239739 [Plectosphaerella plurivora]|uniref:Uncharacterized protein n=1 Tax=Plectosphaerella plurivora TaxID=936078 RepID=A0A9P8VCR3_9PEZI|nr:hypothetical protein F5X68DRAFT_239739 [Plectosphaerella plurivora]